MTLTIIKGLVGTSAYSRENPSANTQAAQSAPSAVQQQQQAAGATQAQAAAAQVSQANDAVVSLVRNGKTAGVSNDRIREYREARDVADEVSRDIQSDDKALDAHDGLDGSASGLHLVG